MYGTCHTGVERVYGAYDFERQSGIDDRSPDKGGLESRMLSFGVARRGVPCSRNDHLVIEDFFIFNAYIVGQCTPRGFGESYTLRCFRPSVGFPFYTVEHAVVSVLYVLQ